MTWTALLPPAAALLALVAGAPRSADPTPAHVRVEAPSPTTLATSPRDPLENARKLYAYHCAPCHGSTGRGDGPAARFLDPRPRDFRLARYRLVSTTNRVASDVDLFEAIAAGLTGTAMLPYAHLPHGEIQQLVELLREFAREGARERYARDARGPEELEEWVREDTTPGPTIRVPEPTFDTVDARARGRLHYHRTCARCHGPEGRGIADPEHVTDEGDPIVPRDLQWGVLKGQMTPERLFRRIRAGIPGTPMPATPEETLSDDEVWDLIHYLGAMIPRGRQHLHDPVRLPYRVPRIEGPLPTDPRDERFERAPWMHAAVAPLRTHERSVTGLSFRALHDGEHIVFKLEWPDPTLNDGTDGGPVDGLAVRVTHLMAAPVIPTPGLPLPLDRAQWLAGPMPEREDPVWRPSFENPDRLCISPIGPERVGAARWISGVWTGVMAITPDKAGRVAEEKKMPVSFAIFDGANRRGPLPSGFTNWLVLTFE